MLPKPPFRATSRPCARGDTDCTVSATVEQVATYLVEARALYRLCPEAVVSPEGDFDKALKEIAGE